MLFSLFLVSLYALCLKVHLANGRTVRGLRLALSNELRRSHFYVHHSHSIISLTPPSKTDGSSSA